MKNQTLLTILLCICVAMAIALFVGSDIIAAPFSYKTLKAVSQSGISFDSRAGSNRPLAQIRVFNEAMNPPLKDTTINMSFYVYSIGKYNNIFQTAPLNNGLRLELAKPNTVALIVGARNPAKFLPFIITSQLELRTWLTFSLHIDRWNHLIMLLDNLRTDATDPTLSYRISEVAFGAGFSRTRPFDGRIKDGSISYAFFERTTGGVVVVNALRILFILLSLLFLVLVSRGPLRRIATSAPRNAAPVTQAKSVTRPRPIDDGDLPL